jgi:8-oxo-dGTP pyrophosphatase MutT (NUDIX family)
MLGRVNYDDTLRETIAARLGGFERQPHDDEGLRRAGVAVALLPDESGAASFAITRRAPGLRAHGGQWALPGGRLDAGEDAAQAALRELREEVGLSLPPDSVLGLLDDYPTRSGFCITPVVVWCGADAHLEPDPAEVAAVFRVRLAELVREDVPRVRRIPQSDRPVLSFPLLGTHIHAPTAAVLYQMREVALRGRDTRVAHFEQPVFAWK